MSECQVLREWIRMMVSEQVAAGASTAEVSRELRVGMAYTSRGRRPYLPRPTHHRTPSPRSATSNHIAGRPPVFERQTYCLRNIVECCVNRLRASTPTKSLLEKVAFRQIRGAFVVALLIRPG